ncbi:unnamed protein product [Alternaria alternata]
MPPPANDSNPIQQPPTKLSGAPPSPEDQERLERRLNAILEDQMAIKRAAETSVAALQEPPAPKIEQPPPKESEPPTKDEPLDNIARVPDEHLPSHQEKQRWSLSKRFSNAMDELLPKLAVVTQKVNTYTGTDYSGVEALRREIKEQEKLVKARRLAIDSAKQALDTALAHQATSQKEVVALLERKHSWSNGDLERYMALIRSEHINDQAVREAKDAVANAENALEDARAQLEKRERAQYHEEQIWSDTIQKEQYLGHVWPHGCQYLPVAIEFGNLGAVAKEEDASSAAATALVPVSATQGLTAIEEDIDRVVDRTDAPAKAPLVVADEVVEESPTAGTNIVSSVEPELVPEVVQESAVTVEAEALTPEEETLTPEERVTIAEEISSSHTTPPSKLESWQQKASFIAHDIVSDRVISMRRIDYTSAILQGAAAGAVITASIIAMLRPN